MDELEQFLNDEARLSVSDTAFAFLAMKKAAYATESELRAGAAGDVVVPAEIPEFSPMATHLVMQTWQALENVGLAVTAIDASCRAQGTHLDRGPAWIAGDMARSLAQWVVLSGATPQLNVQLPPDGLGSADGKMWLLGQLEGVLPLLQSLYVEMEGTPRAHTVSHMIRRLQESLDDHQAKSTSDTALPECGSKMAGANPQPQAGDVIVPEPGTESMEANVIRDQQLALQQAQAERAYLSSQVQASSAQAAQAEQQVAQMSGQLEQVTQQAEQSGQEAMQATEAAAAATEQATAQSVAKMNLGMRMQQFRQQLAEMVAQDPVAEEALSFGEVAGAGAPVTQAQQAQEQEAAMAEQGGAPPTGEAAEEVEQAERAQEEAAQQTQQAAEKTSGSYFTKEAVSDKWIADKMVNGADHRRTAQGLRPNEAQSAASAKKKLEGSFQKVRGGLAPRNSRRAMVKSFKSKLGIPNKVPLKPKKLLTAKRGLAAGAVGAGAVAIGLGARAYSKRKEKGESAQKTSSKSYFGGK